MRLRLLERVGSALGFSPEGRSVRVWIQGMPGGDETEVVAGTITEVREDGAVLFLREPGQEQRWVLAVPHEPGWGLQALWFSFIAVEAFELNGRERLGRWFIRLGSPPDGGSAGGWARTLKRARLLVHPTGFVPPQRGKSVAHPASGLTP